VLSASWDKTAQIWDTATARPIAILPHTDRVVAAFYNGDGSRCVTASHDGTARVWNATNGAPLAVLHHNGKVLWAEFSPDGRRAVTAGADKCARVWDSQTGELILELRGHATEVVVATFSPDGQRIATGCESGSIRVWDAKTGLSIHQLVHGVGAAGAINSLVFSPDGRRLASASLDRTARLWNPGTGAPIREPITHTDHVNHVAFSPDSRLLLTTCHDGSARLWDAGTGLPFGAPLQHKGGVVFGAFSPDGTTIVTTAMDNSARLWNVQTGAALCAPMRAPEAIIYAAFSPDGQRLLTSSWDRTVQLWDIQPRRNDGMQSQWHHDLTSVQFSPNGKFLLLTCYRVAQVIDHETGQPVCDPLHHTDIVSAANFSPDSERIVTGLLDGEAQIWDWRMARLIGRPLRHEKRIRSVHFNQDGTRVLTSSDDATARVWDAQTGLPVTPPLRHADQVWAAQFSPDGRLVVTASDDHTARVWDALTGAPLNEPLQHWDQLGWAEFSPDGLRVATASLDNTACIWDARTGKRLVPPIQHTRTVHRARFSPDGTELVTASMDLTAGIWDARTGQALRAPLQHDHPLSDASFSSDGQRIFTAEEDSGRGRLWDAQSGMPLTEWLEAGGWIHYNACLDRSGSYFAMGGQKGVLRIWHLPPVPIPVPLWFVSFAEAVARIRLTTHGGLEVVPLSEFEAVFEHVGSQETRGFYEHAASWFLADPAQRPADPFSQARGKPAAWLASVSNLTRTTDAANLALLNEKLTSEPGNIDLWKAKAILLEQTNALAQTCEVYSKILQLLPAMERPGATQRAELLLKRASALRQLNRFTEAAADNLAARGIPGPSEGICPRQIDLSAYYNATLDEDWTDKKDPVNKGNRLSNLPHGLLSLDGIDFDIRGIVQLSSRIQKGLDDSYPPKVEQIKVGQRCHKVHFLHGTSWRVREGMYIGSYVVHWQDGRQEEIAIEYGADLREWWNGHRPATAAGRATLAWTGKTPTGQIAGVYHRSWTNPRPEEPIDHLDFISNMTDCAPFLIALTVE
jgi:WD40 repeat protein